MYKNECTYIDRCTCTHIYVYKCCNADNIQLYILNFVRTENIRIHCTHQDNQSYEEEINKIK